jgi:photosystem II stability/assembly factor-like uncharacterized protein
LLFLAGAAHAQSVDGSLETQPAIHLVAHPYDGKRVVAVFQGFTGQEVYSTRDGGLTWHRWAGFPQFEYAERLFASLGQPDVVYLKQAARPLRSAPFGPTESMRGGPLYRSMDFGQTWALVTEDSDRPAQGYEVRVVTPAEADPAEPMHLLGTKRPPFFCTSLGCYPNERELSVHESRDGGITWSAPLFDGGQSGLRHVSYPTPADPKRLFVVADGYAAHLSTDGGRTWSRFAMTFTHTPFWVEQDPHDARVLYGSGTLTDGTRNVIARSDDGGQSWRAIHEFPRLEWNVGQLTADPYRPGRVWLSVHTGLMRSDDRGETWTSVGFASGERTIGDPGERLRVSKVLPVPADDVQAYLVADTRLARTTGSFTPRVAVEYRYGDRYWVSGDRGETASQDYRGYEAVRTGERFGLWSHAERPAGAVPVCRFQGNPAYGQTSRFIALAGSECDIVKASPAFALEGDGEYFVVPPTREGTCPAGLVSVSRFNNLEANVNHRYVADAATAAQMRAAGWYDEGVRMCARPLGSNE